MDTAPPFRHDLERLRSAFHRAFDRSLCLQLVVQPAAQLSAKHVFLGEGTHCLAWRLRGRSATDGGGKRADLSLVLKRVKPGVADQGSPQRRAWTAALARIRALGGLVPPFELVEAGTHVGLVMPYGDAPLPSAAPHWQPVDQRLAELADGLARLGLALGDVPQGRCWEGIPFVYDLSDLGARR